MEYSDLEFAWNLAAGAAAYPYSSAQFYLRREEVCQEVTHYETVLDWEGKYTGATPRVRCKRLSGKKEPRRCKPGSLRFDLSVLFSLDPLSSVRSFSFV